MSQEMIEPQTGSLSKDRLWTLIPGTLRDKLGPSLTNKKIKELMMVQDLFTK